MDNDALYPYQLEDFQKISVLRLRVGDELLLNGPYLSGQFGVLPVISLLYPEGWVVYRYDLPVGMDISSNDNRTVYVTWQGHIPCIQVDAWCLITESLYILRK